MKAPSMLGPRFSPDGKRLAFFSTTDIHIYDLACGSITGLNVSQNGTAQYPLWTPDGKHIVQKSTGGMSWVRADGSGTPQSIYESDTEPAPWSFPPDGCRLAFHQMGANTNRDFWTLPLDTTDPEHPKAGAPEVFLATQSNEVDPTFSRDGRWMAYSSNTAGPNHVFVRPFPEGAGGGGQVQISTTPARLPFGRVPPRNCSM